jgi:hypothetical protein
MLLDVCVLDECVPSELDEVVIVDRSVDCVVSITVDVSVVG